jgi:MarR family transcriptional regulator, organic hydroperoxide resistance regulator
VVVIEDTLNFRLFKLMKGARHVIWPVLAEHGLHPGQDLYLSQLWRSDGQTQSELATNLGIEPPTVTRATQRLERAGFVRREPGRSRGRRVFLTEAGRAVREPVERAWQDADRGLAITLSALDQGALLEQLSRLPKLG